MYAEDDELGSSSGCPDFNEDITCTYIDLDRLIGACGISSVHIDILEEIMKGYSMGDIAEEMQISPQAVRAAFKRAVVKIARKNDETWEDTHEISEDK